MRHHFSCGGSTDPGRLIPADYVVRRWEAPSAEPPALAVLQPDQKRHRHFEVFLRGELRTKQKKSLVIGVTNGNGGAVLDGLKLRLI